MAVSEMVSKHPSNVLSKSSAKFEGYQTIFFMAYDPVKDVHFRPEVDDLEKLP